MPQQDTDKRVTAQPIHADRLARFIDDIEDPFAWVTGPLDRREAHALAGDALHWRAMYQEALTGMQEKQAQIDALTLSCEYACENACGDCAGCLQADEDLGEAGPS